jgi:two-component system, response regulator, stage 0 sporulation protein F
MFVQDMSYGDTMVQNSHDNKGADGAATPQATKPEGRRRVLVAEDDDEMRRLLSKVLDADGYATVECRNGIDLYTHLEPFVVRRIALDFDAIISDIRMPGLTGLEILEDLHDCRGFPPVILITAFGDAGVHIRARRAGAAAVLDKPFGTEELLDKLHEIVPHQQARHGGINGK